MEKLINNEFKNLMCIYKIENKNTGGVYIGSTMDLRGRINSHIRRLEGNIHPNPMLQKSWNINGKENFYFEIVEKVSDVSFLPIAELYHIEKYKRITEVYNINDPLSEYQIMRNREKKIKFANKNKKVENNESQKPKSPNDNKTMQIIIKSEFEFMLDKLKEKVLNCNYVEFSRISEYVIKNISIKDYGNNDIENNLIRVLKTYDLTVYNFESPSYSEEVLNKYGIFTRKRSIISKEIGKKIVDDMSIMSANK